MPFLKFIRLAAVLLIGLSLQAQKNRSKSGILFYNLNTAQGLSDNYIFDMCVDKTGNLWIASGEGLNMFNGKSVTRFFKQDYPQLSTDYTRQVLCDEKNRIWVFGYGGFLTLIDENRRFHKVNLSVNTDEPAQCIIKTKKYGIIILAGDKFYSYPDDKKPEKMDSLGVKDFSLLPVKNFDSAFKRQFLQAQPWSEDEFLFVAAKKFVKVNFQTLNTEKEYNYSNLWLLGRWGENGLLAYDKPGKRNVRIELSTGAMDDPFDSVQDQLGRHLTDRLNRMEYVTPHEIWLTTSNSGLYYYNTKTKELHNFRHNVADPNSLINNSPSVIATEPSGWVFIGNTPNGISYFKRNAVIGQQAVFADDKGNGYDSFISTIITQDNEHYYMGVADAALIWKRSTNTTKFLGEETIPGLSRGGSNYMSFDPKGRIWMAVSSTGIYVLDKNLKVIKLLKVDSADNKSIPNHFVRHMQPDPAGKYMWVCFRPGLARINIENFETDRLTDFPFDDLVKTNNSRTWFEDPDNVWVGNDFTGAWHYTFSTKKLEKINSSNGGISNTAFCFNKDRRGNLYIGTPDGLQILLTNGKKKNITTEDGLLHNRVEALLLDSKDRMWMGNDVGLSCFNIADSSLRVFDERYGLSVQGFRLNAYHQNSDDELVWGTERGIQYFYPDSLLNQKISLAATINRIESRDVIANLNQDGSFRLSASDNSVTFYFSAIDYSKHLRTFYEYKLEGLDENWIRVVDQNFVRYSSLPAGDYTFKVRASNDNKIWEEAANSVAIHIARPIWQTTWFKLFGLITGFLILWLVFRYYRNKQQRQREELENEVVINYFASQINAQHKTDEILWDVAKNCISKLGFEDCVIYLVDDERKVLVQKAAHGPKMQRDLTIFQPIEIPLGQGIVGSVALTGKATLIPNTELDSRYIADDARRYSEVAVPIVVDSKVIGVIDSEHSRKNFFTQQHLNILSTIAVLCANQIQRARAEEEKQKAKIEVLENKQKVTESRLQSLRLQMNPHFLFNALNSIQQMILANEEMVATRYLSRFSKLLRTILVHSDKEEVSLREELEILNLYVELESVRFKDSFSCKIECDEDIDTDEVKVPTLLVQPFVENAIWHGLMHKEGPRVLTIRFVEKEDHLHCIIEDNGVGRKKSQESKLATGKGHTSKGIQVSVERLKSMRNGNGQEGSLNIVDLVNEKGEGVGTRVEIDFPIQT